jgi:hypothetical protein
MTEVLTTLVVASLVTVILHAWRSKSDSPVSLVFRFATAILLALILWNPLIPGPRLSKAPLAVVVDRSRSMTTPDVAGRKRWDAARDLALALARDRRWAPVEFHLLDRRLSAVDEDGLRSAIPDGGVTDFSALEALRRRALPPRAVVLFSDGRETASVVPWTLDRPLHSVGMGSAEAPMDCWIESVRAPGFAFRRTPIEALVRIGRRGNVGDRASLRLTSGEALVARADVRFTTAPWVDVPLHWTPRTRGTHRYDVHLAVPGVPADTNDRRAFSVDVRRDRWRVLYLCGRPGPNYAYLRQQLKTDPNVELVTFVILRDPEDDVRFSDRELSLIPFPTAPELVKTLPTFDLIVLEQFNWGRFGLSGAGVTALDNAVRRGSGLLWIGDGDYFCGDVGPFRDSALASLNPFRSSTTSDRVVRGPERTTIDWVVHDHPALPPSDERSAVRGIALSSNGRYPAGVAPGFQVLATAGARGPALGAAGTRGRGRIMGWAAVDLWRLSLGGADRGAGPWLFQSFFSAAVSWLAGDEGAGGLVWESLPEAIEPGDRVQIRLRLRDGARRSLADADVRVTWVGHERRLTSLGDGLYGGEIPFESGGLHRLYATAHRGGRSLGTSTTDIVVGADTTEDRDTTTDFDRLRALSLREKGSFLTWDRASELTNRGSADSRPRVPLRERPGVLITAMMMLIVEWFFRRYRR